MSLFVCLFFNTVVIISWEENNVLIPHLIFVHHIKQNVRFTCKKDCSPGGNKGVEMQMEILQMLNCSMFVFPDNSLQLTCEEVSYASVNGSLEHAPNYILHVNPPAILHNYLPYNIRYATQVSAVNFSFPIFFGRKTLL